MKFQCSQCSQKLEVSNEYGGQVIACPTCQAEVTIPVYDSSAEIESEIRSSLGDAGHGNMTIAQFMQSRELEGGVSISRQVLEGDQNQKYDYGDMIARGGMGAIFRASDLNVRRDVAVKVLLDPDAASDDDLLRFIEEAQVTGQLEHPSVVPVHDLGIDGAGNVFYTMKLVNGDNLHAILCKIAAGDQQAIKEYSLNRLLNIFQKVCEAMAFSHSKNVIHRDLKPENVMVGEFGEVLVMDWGLAKVLGVSSRDAHVTPDQIDSVRQMDASGALATLAGTIFGTPQFMAPEQARGDTSAMEPRTDIYSLGAILYNILTLRPPVEGKTVDEILTKVTKGEIETPTIYNTQKGSATPAPKGTGDSGPIQLQHCPNSKVPQPLAAIVMKAMATSRNDRYQSVKQLADDIEAFQRGFATTAEEAGALKQFALFINRNKLATFSVLAISLLGAGFIGKTVTSAREIQSVSRKAAPEFINKAREALIENRDDEARAAIDTALGLDRQSPDAWYERARMQFDSYRFDDALASLGRADRSDGEFYQLIQKWSEKVKADGEGVLPEHLTEMAPEIQAVDPTLAARFFARVGSEEEALQLRLTEVLLALKSANPGLEYRSDSSRDWPMGIGYFYWHHIIRETGLEINMGSYLVDRKKLVNVEPLARLPFRLINLDGTGISDLSPLSAIGSLKSLDVSNTPVLSLEGLRGLSLEGLNIHNTRVDDLSPLRGMPLKRLGASDLKTADLSPLNGMQLELINLRYNQTADIEVLRGMPLKSVNLNGATKLSSIEPLRGMQITELDLSSMPLVTDISMLKEMPLSKLELGTPGAPDLSVLDGKSFDSLRINVRTKDLRFLESLKVKEFTLYVGDRFESLEGIQSQREHIEKLSIHIDHPELSPFKDLSPLRGLKLDWLSLSNVMATDLSPLRDVDIRKAYLSLPKVTSINALRDLNLEELELVGQINDISALEGMQRLTEVRLHSCKTLTDIQALATLPNLREVTLPKTATDIEFLRGKPNLIYLNFGHERNSVDRFWRDYDANN